MIKVYTGPMFSGKTKAMFSIKDEHYHQRLIMCFKARKDNRTVGNLWTRSNPDRPIEAVEISDLSEIYTYLDRNPQVKIIFIDEAMLIGGDARVLIDLSLSLDLDIHIAGLDMTSEQSPFGIMPQVLAIADEVIKVKAECSECGKSAPYSYYLLGDKDEVVIGDQEYTALCGRCLVKTIGGRGALQKRLNIKPVISN